LAAALNTNVIAHHPNLRNPLEAGPRIFMTPAIRRGRQARIGRNSSEKGHADFLQSQSQEIFYYFYILRNILQASDCDELEKVPLKFSRDEFWRFLNLAIDCENIFNSYSRY
jgi:hypothetical protein